MAGRRLRAGRVKWSVPSRAARASKSTARADPPREIVAPKVRERRTDLYICLALALAILAVYAQVARFDYVNYDDNVYIIENAHLQQGLSAAGLRWALTATEFALWIPVTRISELVDYQFFGLRSGPPHLINVAWYGLTTLLLFAFLRDTTGSRWRSALAAFLFALHPLHVESVAWVTERKDMLSGFFFLLTLLAYARYSERPSASRYLLVLASFAFGLMAKPMLVTLPFVLVLLDFWPLGRWSTKTPRWKEKIPFLALSAVSSVVTYLAAKSSVALVSTGEAPIATRIGNATVSYLIYISKTLWPVNLAVFYPYARQPAWQPILAAVVLAGASIGLWYGFRRRPYLLVGWLWFLGMLVPVIGLVQAGGQAYADHFMYLPLAGLVIMAAWSVPARPASTMGAAAACLALAVVSWVQAGHWRNSETLFRHALDATDNNYLAHYQLGVYYGETPATVPLAIEEYRAALRIRPASPDVLDNLGAAIAKDPAGIPEAIRYYQSALEIKPDDVLALNNLGAALARIPGRFPEALAAFQAALRIQPGDVRVHRNMGQAFAHEERWPEAVAALETAVRVAPGDAYAHNDLAMVLARTGRRQDAIAQYQEAARLNSHYAAPHNNLALLLATLPGRMPEAVAEYQAALRIEPEDAEIHKNLGNAFAAGGRMQEAIGEFEAALRLRPDFAEAHNNLGFALANVEGRMPQAVEQFETAVRLQPDYRDAQNNLGLALLKLPGHNREAIEHLEIALRLRPDPVLQHTVDQLKGAVPRQ